LAIFSRALATGDVKLRDWGSLLAKECVVAGLLGLTMSEEVVGLGWWRGGYDIADVAGVVLYFSIATWYLGL
jgi:magnesium transporter